MENWSITAGPEGVENFASSCGSRMTTDGMRFTAAGALPLIVRAPAGAVTESSGGAGTVPLHARQFAIKVAPTRMVTRYVSIEVYDIRLFHGHRAMSGIQMLGEKPYYLAVVGGAQ